MRPESIDLERCRVFRYVIASKEMRFIEREERRVHLSDHPDRGLILWGDIPGCGESCDADLSLLLLEHSMSCEGCEDPVERKDASHAFADRVGRALAAEVTRRNPEKAPMIWLAMQ